MQQCPFPLLYEAALTSLIVPCLQSVACAVLFFHRIIIGAPQGTYPGGLSDLPTLEPVALGGLVYLCDINAPGNCTGLLSNESDEDHNDRRLFDGDREFHILFVTVVELLVCLMQQIHYQWEHLRTSLSN